MQTKGGGGVEGRSKDSIGDATTLYRGGGTGGGMVGCSGRRRETHENVFTANEMSL
jgi:hypothetical protein